MVKALLFDFSRVILFPNGPDPVESLNGKYRELMEQGEFDFFEHFRLNEELMDFIYKLQDDYEVYLFTSETIQEAPELQDELGVFKRIFSGTKMNLNKKETSSYEQIAREIAVEPEEIVFVDDSMLNLVAAAEAGFQVVHYQNNDQLFDTFKVLAITP